MPQLLDSFCDGLIDCRKPNAPDDVGEAVWIPVSSVLISTTMLAQLSPRTFAHRRTGIVPLRRVVADRVEFEETLEAKESRGTIFPTRANRLPGNPDG